MFSENIDNSVPNHVETVDVVDPVDDIVNFDIKVLDSTAREGKPPLDLLNSKIVKASAIDRIEYFKVNHKASEFNLPRETHSLSQILAHIGQSENNYESKE